jgi:ribonuclease HI
MKLLLFSDGGARGNPGPAAAGAVIQNAAGETLTTIAKFLGETTNNQAEYAGVILGIQKALEFQPTEIQIFLDSKLAVEQISGRWKIKDLNMKKLVEKAHAGLVQIPKWEISHIARAKNREADQLVNDVLDQRGFKKSAFFRG